MKCDALPRHRDAGFTLLELMCAIFVLTIGVFGVIQMFCFGLDKVRALSDTNVAMRAIQNEVETLRAAPFSELVAGASGFRSLTPEIDRFVKVKPEVRIEDAAFALKKVTVSLMWSGDNGRQITKSVTTLIADKGI
ncbi:MAG: prepilin-type N-terminal cleavage/methylation domain-containing protein [Candidatus Hydrogenedentes bacterium]|nr:prepilin-type N-terminal cleavage/methylation domain-containing protein [Candidatus Hydrogenedentota bacterium]